VATCKQYPGLEANSLWTFPQRRRLDVGHVATDIRFCGRNRLFDKFDTQKLWGVIRNSVKVFRGNLRHVWESCDSLKFAYVIPVWTVFRFSLKISRCSNSIWAQIPILWVKCYNFQMPTPIFFSNCPVTFVNWSLAYICLRNPWPPFWKIWKFQDIQKLENIIRRCIKVVQGNLNHIWESCVSLKFATFRFFYFYGRFHAHKISVYPLVG